MRALSKSDKGFWILFIVVFTIAAIIGLWMVRSAPAQEQPAQSSVAPLPPIQRAEIEARIKALTDQNADKKKEAEKIQSEAQKKINTLQAEIFGNKAAIKALQDLMK